MEEEAKNEDRLQESDDEGPDETAVFAGHQDAQKEAQEAAKMSTVKEAVKEKQEVQEESSESGSDEDDFLARFAARKNGVGQGYPTPTRSDPVPAEEEEDSSEEASNDIRGRRAQKREQQMAAALQKRQERENVQELVNGVKKAQRASKQEAKDADLNGPIPEGNTCGVCKEDFPSRSTLFKHIKATGHAMLKPAPEEAVKGRKKKR